MRRFYSIQSKLFFISLLSITIIVGGGCLSLYLSTQLLSTTNFFISNTLPRIETAKALEKVAFEIRNIAGDLQKAVTQEQLNDNYRLLISELDRLEVLTAKMSQEEAGTDILALNWTSQAIRAQAQLTVQMGVRQLSLDRQAHEKIEQLRIQLATQPPLEEKKLPAGIDIRHLDMMHAYIVELLTRLNQLELARSSEEVDAIEKRCRESRETYLNDTQPGDNQLRLPAEKEMLAKIQGALSELFALQRANLKADKNINGILGELNGQVLKLTAITTEHDDTIFERFYTNARQVIHREKGTLYFMLLLVLLSVSLLFILHKRIVVHGLGDRLSRISRAMSSDPGEKRTRDLPVEGRDEIADMARALDVLLDKAVQLRDMATVDELTQVYNRRKFFELAGKEVSRVDRTNTPSIILMLDIDHFKSLNDTYGHIFGDKVLHLTAQSCLSSIRKIDIFARYGGEEFVALMPETDPGEGLLVAERIRQSIASMKFRTDDDIPVSITVSLGLTAAALNKVTIDQALQQADLALYQAKSQGRNRVVAWQPEPDTTLQHELPPG